MAKVLITGASGLTGGYLLNRLERDGHEITCYLRPESTAIQDLSARYEVSLGDSADATSLGDACRGQDCLIHLVNIRQTPAVLEAVQASGIGRAVIVSTTSVHSVFHEASGTYKEMEQRIFESPRLPWVIVRPSMIYGNEKDKNMHRLLRFLSRARFAPVVNKGMSMIQPVHADDLAAAITATAFSEACVHRAFDTPGRDAVPYRDLVALCMELLGVKGPLVPVPLKPVHLALSLFERLTGKHLPVRSEQILRQTEDKVYSFADAAETFGYSPRSLREGLSSEIAILREKQIIAA